MCRAAPAACTALRLFGDGYWSLGGIMSGWVTVCALSEVDEDEPKGVTVGGVPVGVYLVDGEVCALHDVCSHAHALLSQGMQHGPLVECPLHGALFDIRTGEAQGPPVEGFLPTYQARVVNGKIEIKL